MKKMILGTALLTSLVLTSCKPPQEAQAAGADPEKIEEIKQAIPVEAVLAQMSEESKSINASTTTAGIREVYLPAKSTGTIISAPVKMGQRLRRGNTILAVESHVYKAAVTQAKVGVEQAKLNFNAVEKLFEKGSVSEAEFIQAKSGLTAAEAALEMNQYNYNNCWLRAPFSGALTFLDPAVEKGNMIAAGTPVARMVDISKLNMTLHFGEDDIIHISEGNSAELYVPALEKTLEGKVTAVAEGSDPATGSFAVEVTTENPDEKVKAGMTGRITIYTDNTQIGYLVPTSAVVSRGSGKYVLKSVGNQTVEVPVSTYPVKHNRSLVQGDIEEGDTLITTGLSRLTDGDPVTPTIFDM